MVKQNTYNAIARRALTVVAAAVQGRAMDYSGNYCAAGEPSAGITEYDANAGDQIAVIYEGTALIEAAAVIDIGALVKATTNGKIIMGAATNDYCIGRALYAGVTNDFVEIHLSEVQMSLAV
jgi:hypothetical protein